MLQLTDAARQVLHKSLAAVENSEHDGKCFRIVPKDARHLTLELAEPAESDALFTHEGDTILALPESLAPFFDGKSLGIDNSGQLTLS